MKLFATEDRSAGTPEDWSKSRIEDLTLYTLQDVVYLSEISLSAVKCLEVKGSLEIDGWLYVQRLPDAV